MSPKERVRVNIYKQLLKEEKQKNKRKSYLSISVFVIGIFAGSIYNFVPSNKMPGLEIKTTSNSDGHIFQQNNSIDEYFNGKSISMEKEEIKADEYFLMNMQA
ncbi:MAG: hypothetical protein Q7K48_00760 [Fusobacterium sp. JB021]|nr:hypothetical protein [Fusobacterium sp. JB020]MDP0492836.1 hypothetical protein [Fusobacterium sp. JB021]MDP0506891.1 hypothetical protein [Fusobacterium sp. JB019]